MILQSCFPEDQNVRLEIAEGDVVSASCQEGVVVLSINGDIISYGDIVFRAVTPQSIIIENSDWPDCARELAAEIVDLWQDRQPAGEKVIELQRAARLIRTSLAGLLGVSGQTIYRWESNQVSPTDKDIIDFRKLFDV